MTMGGHNLPIVLKTNDTMGRYLAASRKIEARELIFQEDPIIMCPNAPPDSDSATCVGCCGISQNSVPCPKCGWPVCKEECGDSPDHANFECKVFSKERIKLPLPNPYCFIAEAEYIKVLRCLLLRELGIEDSKQLERWKLLLDMEAHVELRKSIPKIMFMSKLIRNFVHDMCKLTQFDDSIIDFIFGAVDVNAFRNVTNPIFQNGKVILPTVQNPTLISFTSSPFTRNATVLYEKGSLVAHGCRRNTQSLPFPDGRLEMRAGSFIEVQELLTHAYVDLMIGTPERRRILREQFYFDCCCQRCSDPTELGTYFSALKCQQCDKGYLIMDNPLDSGPYWKCNNSDHCMEIQTTEYETELVEELRIQETKILKSGRKNNAMIAGWINLLERFGGRFHENHYALLQIQVHLIRCMAKVSKPPVELVQDMQKMINKYKKLYLTFYPNLESTSNINSP